MDARFRIRTREGKELEPRSLEIFTELVRSGVIRPNDLVFDALTGEWAPAHVHPMVRLCLDPLVVDPLARSLEARPPEARTAETGPTHAEPASDGGGPASPGAPEEAAEEMLGLDLVEQRHLSPDEEAQAFLAQMEEERRSDTEQPLLAQELPLVHDRPGVVEGLVEAPTPPRRRVEPIHVPFPAVVDDDEQPRRRRRRARSPFWLALIGVAAVGLVVVVRVEGRGAAEEARLEGLAQAEAAQRPVRRASASDEEVRQAAYEGFLREVDGVRGLLGLGEVPAVWLEGTYLAGAAGHPEVRRYWERALAYVETVQSQELELYRTAFLTAAGGYGLSGPVRSLRLATALEEFTLSAPRRAGVYQHMREVATAALDLHDALVALEGRVTYEPIRGGRVSADPVLEAAGVDEEAQLLLEAALDRVLRALHGPDGTELGDRDRVSGWLAEGLGDVGR